MPAANRSKRLEVRQYSRDTFHDFRSTYGRVTHDMLIVTKLTIHVCVAVEIVTKLILRTPLLER